MTSLEPLPMRLAVYIRHGKPAGYRIRIGKRAGDRRSHNTLSGPAFFAITRNLPATAFQSAVGLSPASVIAAVHSPGSVLMSRGLSEPQLTRLGTSISQGTRLITNLVGGISALQSLSFNPRVKFCQEPTRGLFHRLVVSKVLLLPAAVHGNNHDSRSVGNAQI